MHVLDVLNGFYKSMATYSSCVCHPTPSPHADILNFPGHLKSEHTVDGQNKTCTRLKPWLKPLLYRAIMVQDLDHDSMVQDLVPLQYS